MNTIGTLLFVSIGLTLLFEFSTHSSRALCRVKILSETYPVYVTKEAKLLFKCRSFITPLKNRILIQDGLKRTNIKIYEKFNF